MLLLLLSCITIIIIHDIRWSVLLHMATAAAAIGGSRRWILRGHPEASREEEEQWSTEEQWWSTDEAEK